MVGVGGRILHSEDETVWPFGNGPDLRATGDMAFFDNRFVGVGDWLISSPDGLNWSTHVVPATSRINSDKAFGNTVFIAGNEGLLSHSDNLIDWTPAAPSLRDNFVAVVYGAKKFVAIGEFGSHFTSDDGINWKRNGFLGFENNAGKVAYGNGRVVAAGIDFGEAGVAVSDDGVHWSKIGFGFGEMFPALILKDGRFMAIVRDADNPERAFFTSFGRSEKGVNWIFTDIPSQNGFLSLAAKEGKIVAAGYGHEDSDKGVIISSSDGGET